MFGSCSSRARCLPGAAPRDPPLCTSNQNCCREKRASVPARDSAWHGGWFRRGFLSAQMVQGPALFGVLRCAMVQTASFLGAYSGKRHRPQLFSVSSGSCPYQAHVRNAPLLGFGALHVPQNPFSERFCLVLGQAFDIQDTPAASNSDFSLFSPRYEWLWAKHFMLKRPLHQIFCPKLAFLYGDM